MERNEQLQTRGDLVSLAAVDEGQDDCHSESSGGHHLHDAQQHGPSGMLTQKTTVQMGPVGAGDIAG